MKKPLPQIAFGYPRRGLTGLFNTFRLGVSVLERCQPGREVELVDARSKKVLGRATVLYAHVGLLRDMAPAHCHLAHNWKEHQPASERPAKLIASMKKRYPPNRVRDDSVCTVIYLQSIEEEPKP